MSSLGKRILLSIPLGWVVAVGLILISSVIENEKIRNILLWNIRSVSALAGNGPILGYDAQGNPIYEGTPILLFFGLIGLLSSFLIYPILVFLSLTLYSHFCLREKKFTDQSFQ